MIRLPIAPSAQYLHGMAEHLFGMSTADRKLFAEALRVYLRDLKSRKEGNSPEAHHARKLLRILVPQPLSTDV